MLQRGSQAFQAGNYPLAAETFARIQTEFNEEPAWIEGQLPRRLLPLAGYASLRSGQYDAAVQALELYLNEYADKDPQPKDFVRYTLALSQLQHGDAAAAKATFAAMRENAGSPSLAGIAAVAEARLAEPSDALALLQEVMSSAASTRIVIQARLAFIGLAMEQGATDEASRELLNTRWGATTMPELATLSFLSLEAGDRLLESGNPRDALRAYRLVAPREQLIREQSARLAELQARLRDRAGGLPTEQFMWIDFYRQIVSSLTSQLQSLEATADYAAAIDLRKARCFTQLGRPLESWILLERLALGDDPAIAPEAHRLWIRVARDMRQWNASAAIARRYVEQYPERDDVNEALYWIAQAQMENANFEDALATLATLAERALDPSLRASAHYFSGYCLSRLDRWSDAIKMFQEAAATNPNSRLAGQSTLWIGIAWFALGEFDAAITAYIEIGSNPEWNFLHPEAEYRNAAAQYALGEYAAADAILADWLAAHTLHERRNEALLLAGETREALGDADSALPLFDSVDPDDRELRYLATRNIARIHLDKRMPASAAASCEAFATASIPLRHVGDFHELWANCLEANGQHSEANRLLKSAIESYGDDLAAEGIVELIERIQTDHATEAWEAMAATRPTLASRLQLALARTLEEEDRQHEAEAVVLRMTGAFDRKDLPPECLVRIGASLAAIGSTDAESYLLLAIDSFPDSRYKGAAYLSLAQQAARLHRDEQALDYLAMLAIADPGTAEQTPALTLKATLFQSIGRHDEAQTAYEALLAQRGIAPNDKAMALLGLGETYLELGDAEAAYGCFQRVFTLYRGARGPVAESYLRCIAILRDRNDIPQASAVCAEFLQQSDLSAEPAYATAQTLQRELLPSEPPTNDINAAATN